MATIDRRGNLQWRARVRRLGYPVQTKTLNSRAEAEAWARQAENEMDRGVFVPRAEAESTTLAEALDRYGLEITPKKRGAARERYRVQQFRRHPLAARYLATLRSKDIADYIREREEGGAGANVIRLDLALLSHLFETCRSSWGMECLINPVALAKSARPKLPPGRDRRLRPREEGKLLAACSSALASVVCFALETAMRRSEIAELHWEQIDLKARTARLPQTKNGEVRTVPLSSRALAILRSLPRRLGGSVFGLRAKTITEAFEWAAHKAGITDLTFHDLRHEATSRISERTDLDLIEISAITGHKTLQMLKRYTHLKPEDLAKRLG
jgi:integrase